MAKKAKINFSTDGIDYVAGKIYEDIAGADPANFDDVSEEAQAQINADESADIIPESATPVMDTEPANADEKTDEESSEEAEAQINADESAPQSDFEKGV